MSGELLVAADLDQGERPAEMPPGGRIAAGVVRHPSGHLGQGRRCGEQRRVVRSSVGAEEPRRHVGLQVPDHAGVQMTAARLQIGRAECPHGYGVRVVDQLALSRRAAGCPC